MKSTIISLFSLCLVMLAINVSQACDIKVKPMVDETKTTFAKGEEVVVLVTIINTHRNCHEPIDKVKFTPTNGKILGATKWNETSEGTFERKLKVKVAEDATDGMTIKVDRDCPKDGGHVSYKLDLSK